MTLSLYHVICGRGNPLAEQLTRTESLTLGTVIKVAGLEVKTGDSEKIKGKRLYSGHTCLIRLYIKFGIILSRERFLGNGLVQGL